LKRSATVLVLVVITITAVFGSWQTALRGLPIQSVERRSSSGENTRVSGILLSLGQNKTTLVLGSPAQIAVHVSITTSSSFRVYLSAQPVPSGVAVSFSPMSGRASFTSTMTILADSSSRLGTFKLAVVASGGGITRSSTLSVLVVAVVHDLAVTAADGPATATIGSIVPVNATVANYGSVSESFGVELYVNNSLVATQSSITLFPATEKWAVLSWNTTGYIAGHYSLVVVVPPVLGESDIGNNRLQVGTLLLVNISPGNPPIPSPGSPQPTQTNLRDLAIVVGIAWIVIVAAAIFRRTLRTAVGRVKFCR